MVVQANAINFYIKYDGQWLMPLTNISTPLGNCLFFLYSILNASTAQFASNCYNLNIPTLLLTL
jgi:hypothetical protein